MAGVVVGAVGLLAAVSALVVARRRGGGPSVVGEERPVSEMARPNA